MVNKKTDPLGIIYRILEVAKPGVLPSLLISRANLSGIQFYGVKEGGEVVKEGYFSKILRFKLADITNNNGKKTIKTNEKGLDFIQRYKGLDNLLNTSDEKYLENEVSPYPNRQSF